MPALPLLHTARTLLRLAAASDVPALLRYWTDNREHLRRSRHAFEEGFFTDAFWRQRVELALREFEQGESLRLVLFDRQEPARVVGTINFTQLLRAGAQFCYLGYGIAQSEEGRGRMSEALRVALAFVFDEMRLHRVMANYMPRNERSGRLLRALGFVVEGYARDYLLIDGVWEDHILTSKINPSWSGES